MTTRRTKFAAAALVASVMAAVPAPAHAGTGCNGVVNILVWGCAPWDNNNGANFPYYKKKQVSVQVPRGAKVTIRDGHAVVSFGGRDYPVVNGASGVVAAGGGNVVAAGGMNLQVWIPN